MDKELWSDGLDLWAEPGWMQMNLDLEIWDKGTFYLQDICNDLGVNF